MNSERVPHYISKPSRSTSPKRFLFYDTETKRELCDRNKWRHTLRIGHARIAHRTRSGGWFQTDFGPWSNARQFWDLVASQCHPTETLWVISHNAMFDLAIVNLWGRYKDEGIEIDDMVIEGPPVIIYAHKGNCPIIFADSMNWFPCSVAALGEQVGKRKTAIDFTTCDTTELAEHCRVDVEIISKAVLSLVDTWRNGELGPWKPTTAGLAWSAWRSRYLNRPVYISANDAQDKLERDSYYGGRCEPYFIGRVDTPVCVLDVNSMYPAVMLYDKYPISCTAYSEGGEVSTLVSAICDNNVIADIDIESEVDEYTVRYGKRLTFAFGTFRTVLCGGELRRALALHHVKAVHRYALYDTADLFTEYVTWAYNRRTAAIWGGERLVYKALLVGLPGKFGQRSPGWVPDQHTMMQAPFGSWIETKHHTGSARWCRAIAGKCYYQVPPDKREELPDSFPAISAMITANGRELLRNLHNCAGHRDVYYADTDSLHCSLNGYQRLADAGHVHPSDIGKLKIEGMYTSAIYRGWKDYTLGSELVKSGVGPRDKQIDDTTYEVTRFEHGDHNGVPFADGDIRETLTRLHLPPPPLIGAVGKDGWVQPPLLYRAPNGDTALAESLHFGVLPFRDNPKPPADGETPA